MICNDCKKKSRCPYKPKSITKSYCELKKQTLFGKVKKAIFNVVGGRK